MRQTAHTTKSIRSRTAFEHRLRICCLNVICLLGFVACEQAEPTSYLIPKEDRSLTMQAPVTDSAKTEASASPTGSMRLLPG
ncbi:MAG: hypothetical protein VX014_05875, partial [Verrucomicrobiota bacterium]|nr:hypothetical protein [Verrucomicrobiota bacterium]